jgi:hypothetical protein
MRRLTAAEVHAQKIAELGLDPTALDLTSVEGIAGALRRAASFLCPCATTTLVRAVIGPLRGLVPNLDESKEFIEETLEAMIAHGDIVEQRELGSEQVTPRLLLYAAPASFVVRESGLVVLLGVSADQLSPLPDDLERRIEYVGHLRRLSPVPGEDLRQELKPLGLIELTYAAWLKSPAHETAVNHVSNNDRALDSVQPSRDLPGLLLLDPERPVRYYRGRWVAPRAQTGRYVARRSQAYGADLWCYVQLRDGQPERMIDLPHSGSRWRGCDDAWRLQMAIDAQRGEPQRFRVRLGAGGTAVFEFFSPIPAWARRRWDAVGEPVPSSGCLFAYRFAKTEIDEELRFARDTLWLAEMSSSTR